MEHVEETPTRREMFGARLPPELTKQFRRFVVDEHGTYNSGWLSTEVERAIRTYLLINEMSRNLGKDGDLPRQLLSEVETA